MIIGIVVIVCLILGFLIGFFMVKILTRIENKRITKQAEEVLEGKRENFIEVEGKKIPAEKFRLKDEDGNEKVINLKGGIEEDATKKEIENTEEIIPNIDPPNRKDSPSIREKKRIIRGRTSRIRRYG